MKPLHWFLALLALSSPALANVDLEAMKSSVVSVDVTFQEQDYYSPWKQPMPRGTGGSGFYIGERRLMTNAHVVSNARIIRVKRPDRPDKVDARILYIAHDCDLAILTVDESEFFDGMLPLEIGGLPALRSMVTVVGYPVGGLKLSITEGVVSRIQLQDYVHTGVDRHLAIQVDAAINPGNSGGPVMQDGGVVGVAFQTRFFSQNIGYMIPVPVIRHFLADVADGTYDGYTSLGMLTDTLENDALRSYLGVPDGQTGVVVTKVLPHSSVSGLLHRGDVVHFLDGHRIENDGTVSVDGEYLELAYLVQEKYVGDTIELKIRRDGKPLDVAVELRKWDVKMHPATEYDLRPEYLVLGGYVFLPLTANYLPRAGFRTELLYWFNEFYTLLEDEMPGQEQLVILSRVLPHDSTRYRDYTNAIVTRVNGKPPRDFHSFVKMVGESERVVIEFEGVNAAPLVLTRSEIAKIQAAILTAYGIPEDRYLRGGAR